MKLEFKKEFERFKVHFNYDGNDRIVFSAPFGIGKTTFLNDYFAKRTDYEVFHLFPANYSVSENDNIFEYIKYDILYQLIEKIDIEHEEYSYSQTLASFLSENGDKLVKPFINGISLLNKEVSVGLKTIYKYLMLSDAYFKYHKKIQKDDYKEIGKFSQEIETRIGSIYEQNFITELIQYYISKISETDSPGIKRKTILIIDDLDRIDPDHFFRILNIFAAHVDQNIFVNGLKNKFGFNQVLFVFDKDNARNIFHYRYGPNVDYDGYINKFYSRTIYDFEPFPDIKDYLSFILEKIQLSGPSKNLINFKDDSNLYVGFIYHILHELLIRKQINLRNLLKLLDKELSLPVRRLNLPSAGDRLTNFNLNIIICFDFIIMLLGEPRSLEKALFGISQFSDFLAKYNDKFYLLQHLISLMDYKQHLFSSKQEISVYRVEGQAFHYNLINSPSCVWARLCDDQGKAIEAMDLLNQISAININGLIYNCYLICKDLGIYK